MNSDQPDDSGDKPAYEKDLIKQAEEAAAEIERRAAKELEAGRKQADEAAEAVREAIRDQARRLADEILTDSGRHADAEPAASSKKKTGKRKAKRSAEATKTKKKKRSKSKRKSSKTK